MKHEIRIKRCVGYKGCYNILVHTRFHYH